MSPQPKSISQQHLYYILRGGFFIISQDGIKKELSAGTCCLLPAGYSFAFGCDDVMEQIYFHLRLCDFGEIDILKNCAGPITCPFSKEQGDSYLTMINSRDLMGSLLAQREIYSAIFTLLRKNHITLQENKYSPQVCRAIEYIDSHLSLQLNISRIAENSFAAPSTLTRDFKRETGMTIGQYIDYSIMSQAEQMLLSTKASILEISDRLGFCDQFYFARRFKEKYGMAPTEYRRSTLL